MLDCFKDYKRCNNILNNFLYSVHYEQMKFSLKQYTIRCLFYIVNNVPAVPADDKYASSKLYLKINY